MLYKEVTEDDIVKFLLNEGIREGITVAEVRILAERFEWPEYNMYWGWQGKMQSVPREAVIGVQDYSGSVPKSGVPAQSSTPDGAQRRKILFSDVNSMIEMAEGDMVAVCVPFPPMTYYRDRSHPIEIYKEVDDWWWVVLDLCDPDFFYNSPLLHREELNLFYRCDQMSGLLALLEWACPADRVK